MLGLSLPLPCFNLISVQSSNLQLFVLQPSGFQKVKFPSLRVCLSSSSMSASIDRALMAMSLEEDDEPFTMPDLPELCSSEKNVQSIVGRLLNPDCQKISNLILNLPRKWQIADRVRGVALSNEKFQFIFDYKHEMEAILNKGVHTFNEWALAIDRWVENPPPDYLQFIPVWIQIRNIPVNHYTIPTITMLGDFVGKCWK